MMRISVVHCEKLRVPRLQNRGISLQRSFSTKKPFDPLRILFCGSDQFSAASLQALHVEHATNPNIIQSLHVVCKKPKPTGRGLKTLREGEQVFSSSNFFIDISSSNCCPCTKPIITIAPNRYLSRLAGRTCPKWRNGMMTKVV